MTNEYGAPLDRNGYAPSILCNDEHTCWLCECSGGRIERHEVFGGALREKSKAHGLWLGLCPECHRTAPHAVHRNAETAKSMKMFAQTMAMERYGWDMPEWLGKYYKNYREDD